MLESAWSIILNLLHSVAKGATDTPHSCSGTPSEGNEGDEVLEDDGLGVGRVSTWGGACLTLAFKCLQLIVDDFLERLPLEQAKCCIKRSIIFVYGNCTCGLCR